MPLQMYVRTPISPSKEPLAVSPLALLPPLEPRASLVVAVANDLAGNGLALVPRVMGDADILRTVTELLLLTPRKVHSNLFELCEGIVDLKPI